jgi:hypothetical protein
MTTVATVDQLQYLFTYPFKDAEWKRKLFIAFLLAIAGFVIPVIPWVFLAGYIGKIIGGAMRAERDLELPEWDEWGDLFIMGLRLFVLWFIVTLPIWLLFGVGYTFMFLPVVFASLASNEESLALVLVPMFGTVGGMFFLGASIIFGLLIALILPPAAGHVINNEALGAVFRVREWWSIFRANFGGYLLSFILVIGTMMLGAYAFQVLYMTVVLCCLVPFLSAAYMVYLGVVSGALYGQAYRVGLEKVGDTEGAEEGDA